MKRMLVIWSAVALFTWFPSHEAAVAGGPEDSTVAQSRLSRFEGAWIGDATVAAEGRSVTVRYHAEFKRAAGGSGLYMDEWFDSPELGHMRGGNLIGYDPRTRTVRWFSVDNMGTAHEHAGTWSSDDRLDIEHRGLRDGGTYVETLSFVFLPRQQLDVHIVGTMDGKTVEEISGRFHRADMRMSRAE